jgi:hypothetical protein
MPFCVRGIELAGQNQTRPAYYYFGGDTPPFVTYTASQWDAAYWGTSYVHIGYAAGSTQGPAMVSYTITPVSGPGGCTSADPPPDPNPNPDPDPNPGNSYEELKAQIQNLSAKLNNLQANVLPKINNIESNYIPKNEKSEIIQSAFYQSIRWSQPKFALIKGEIDGWLLLLQTISASLALVNRFLEEIKQATGSFANWVRAEFPKLQSYVNNEIKKIYQEINRNKPKDYDSDIADLRRLINQVAGMAASAKQEARDARTIAEKAYELGWATNNALLKFKDAMATALAGLKAELKADIAYAAKKALAEMQRLEKLIRGEIEFLTNSTRAALLKLQGRLDIIEPVAMDARTNAIQANSRAIRAQQTADKAISDSKSAISKANKAIDEARSAQSLATEIKQKLDIFSSQVSAKLGEIVAYAAGIKIEAFKYTDGEIQKLKKQQQNTDGEIQKLKQQQNNALIANAISKALAILKQADIGEELEDIKRRLGGREQMDKQYAPLLPAINAKLDQIIPTIAGIPLVVGNIPNTIKPMIPTIPQIGNIVQEKVCNPQCQLPSVSAGNNAADAANKANSNLGNKIDGLKNGADTAVQAAQLTLLNTINKKMGSEIVGGLSGKLVAGFKWLQLDRALNILTFAATVHNGAMLSNDIIQTLVGALTNVLTLIIPKDDAGTPFNIGGAINSTVENTIKGIIGAENYTNLTTGWAKANRIYQATTNVLNSFLSLSQTILQASEMIAAYTGKIGNALKKGGVVLENAYGWMNPQPRFNRVTQTLESLQNGASTIQMVTQAPLDIVNATTEFNNSATEFVKAVKEDNKPGNKAVAQPEPDELKEKETQAKTDSQPNPFDFSDLFDGED